MCTSDAIDGNVITQKQTLRVQGHAVTNVCRHAQGTYPNHAGTNTDHEAVHVRAELLL